MDRAAHMEPGSLTVHLDWYLDPDLHRLRDSDDASTIERYRNALISRVEMSLYGFSSVRDMLHVDDVMHDATHERMTVFFGRINAYVDACYRDPELSGIDTRLLWKRYCEIVLYNIRYAHLRGQDVEQQGGQVIIPLV